MGTKGLRFREITRGDVPALFAVRVATRENALSREELEGLGITELSVAARLDTTYRGWLCEDGGCGDSGRVIGFAMGNRQTGEMWVIAVLPEYEGMGVGRRLMDLVETWLWREGWSRIWLTTDVDPGLRAYGFYKRQGWLDQEVRDGLRHMQKARPDPAPSIG